MIFGSSLVSGLHPTPLGDGDNAKRRPARNANLKGDSIPTKPIMTNGIVSQLLTRAGSWHGCQRDGRQMQKLRKQAKNKA